MKGFKLRNNQSVQEAIMEYVTRYWEHNVKCDVIVSLGLSFDGVTYDLQKAVVYHLEQGGVKFLNFLWRGERYIKIFGIRSIQEVDVYGGIYDEDE